MPTDKERIDKLERMLAEKRYTGRCILRWSTTGRGFRLLETSQAGDQPTVREAIDAVMKEGGEWAKVTPTEEDGA